MKQHMIKRHIWLFGGYGSPHTWPIESRQGYADRFVQPNTFGGDGIETESRSHSDWQEKEMMAPFAG